MATFDQLSAEQRAIVELVLQRGKSYDELADMLAMPDKRVRDLARDALVALAPVTARGVDEEWRGQLADYVLGQQSGPEATATRGHLRRSEAARAWARSLLDSLDTLYEQDLPTIPEGEKRPARERRPRRRREESAEEEPEAPARGELSPEAREAVRRRRLLAGAGALAVVLLVVVLLWPVGVLTGSDDNDKGGSGGQASAVSQPAGKGVPAGVAIIAERGGKRQVIVQAASLPPNKNREAYEVWLYNSPKDAKSLGAQVTDSRGTFQGAGPLPSDYAHFQFVDVSREPIDQNRAHSGDSVLRGKIGKLKTASSGTKKGQAVILGQIVLTPPK